MDPGTFPSFLLSYFVQLVPSSVDSWPTTWCSLSSSLFSSLASHSSPLWHHAIIQTNILVIHPIPWQRISTVLIRYTFKLRRVPYLHIGPNEMAALRGTCAFSRAGPLLSSHILIVWLIDLSETEIMAHVIHISYHWLRTLVTTQTQRFPRRHNLAWVCLPSESSSSVKLTLVLEPSTCSGSGLRIDCDFILSTWSRVRGCRVWTSWWCLISSSFTLYILQRFVYLANCLL